MLTLRLESRSTLAVGDVGSLYIGFDPTAPSLHVGNLIGVAAAMHLAALQIPALLVVGGATVLAGDPSFRRDAKRGLPPDVVATNTAAMARQLALLAASAQRKMVEHGVLLASHPPATVLNNADWQGSLALYAFLSSAAGGARISAMLSRDRYGRPICTLASSGTC